MDQAYSKLANLAANTVFYLDSTLVGLDAEIGQAHSCFRLAILFLIAAYAGSCSQTQPLSPQ